MKANEVRLYVLRGGLKKQALVIELFPGRSQPERSVSALQEPESQFTLQRLYLLRNGGLGDVVFLRRL